jgi:hypothetical protein
MTQAPSIKLPIRNYEKIELFCMVRIFFDSGQDVFLFWIFIASLALTPHVTWCDMGAIGGKMLANVGLAHTRRPPMSDKTPQDMLNDLITKAQVSASAWANRDYTSAQKKIARSKRAMSRELALESITDDVAYAVRKRIAMAKATAAACADPTINALLNPAKPKAEPKAKPQAKTRTKAEPKTPTAAEAPLANG